MIITTLHILKQGPLKGDHMTTRYIHDKLYVMMQHRGGGADFDSILIKRFGEVRTVSKHMEKLLNANNTLFDCQNLIKAEYANK